MSAALSRLELKVSKALVRKDFAVAACADALSNKVAGEISLSLEQRERRDFLASSLQNNAAAESVFERVLSGGGVNVRLGSSSESLAAAEKAARNRKVAKFGSPFERPRSIWAALATATTESAKTS